MFHSEQSLLNNVNLLIYISTYVALAFCAVYRGSYMSAHVLLNLLNDLGKRDKMQGLRSSLSLFRNKFNKFNNTGAPILDSIYHMTLKLNSYFWRTKVRVLPYA